MSGADHIVKYFPKKMSSLLSGLYCDLPSHHQPVPVPLVSVEVRAVVRNFLAEVELRQKYQNKENNPLEVLYFFPVEESASVIGCKALLDGEKCLLDLCNVYLMSFINIQHQ